MREVTRQTIRDYQAWLLSRYATSSAHVHLIALRRFFEHLEATDLLLINPRVKGSVLAIDNGKRTGKSDVHGTEDSIGV